MPIVRGETKNAAEMKKHIKLFLPASHVASAPHIACRSRATTAAQSLSSVLLATTAML